MNRTIFEFTEYTHFMASLWYSAHRELRDWGRLMTEDPEDPKILTMVEGLGRADDQGPFGLKNMNIG